MLKILLACAILIAAGITTAQAEIVGTPLSRNLDQAHAERLQGLLEEEAGAIEQAIGHQMRVIVMPTTNPVVARFVAQGVLKTDPETMAHQQNGLAAVFSDGGRINGKTVDACYVIFDHQRGGHLWRNFIEPMTRQDNLHPGAAFLLGHEVGHCLDTAERNKRLASGASSLAQAATFGVLGVAWTRAGGGDQANMATYSSIHKAFFNDIGQRQYQERVADAFGVLWAWHRGAGEAMLKTVTQRRGYAQVGSSHATAPVLVGIDQFQAQASVAGIGELWTIARALQLRTGVDAVLVTGEHQANKPKTLAKESKQETDKQATVMAQPKPERDAMGRVRFDSLKRFGSGAQGNNGFNGIR